jgi:Domain of unknown function (DUF4160)
VRTTLRASAPWMIGAIASLMRGAKQSGMLVIFRESGLRYFFFSNEGSPREVPHIHVKGGGCDAKVWLEQEPVIAESYGFNSRELARIIRVIMEHRDLILRAWHEHFGDGSSI